jgi:hypothetical protein
MSGGPELYGNETSRSQYDSALNFPRTAVSDEWRFDVPELDGVLRAKNKTRFTRLRETACGLL